MVGEGVGALERTRKPRASERRLAMGRQALQIAALVSAQLPDDVEEATEVVEHAMRIVRDWLERSVDSGPSPTPLPPRRGVYRLKDHGREQDADSPVNPVQTDAGAPTELDRLINADPVVPGLSVVPRLKRDAGPAA